MSDSGTADGGVSSFIVTPATYCVFFFLPTHKVLVSLLDLDSLFHAVFNALETLSKKDPTSSESVVETVLKCFYLSKSINAAM